MIDHNVLFNLERQMRLIAEHREKDAEKAIRTVCSAMMKEMQNLTANEYTKSADGDDRLTFDTLYRNGRYSRFLEEAEKTIDGFTPQIQSEIESLVKDSYKQMYDGMVDAVTKAATSEDLRRDLKAVRAVRPEVLKQAVMNPISGLTLPDRLEKHRRDIIYDIKQQIGVGLAVGDRYSTIARRIADSCNMSYQKAVRIARTESHRVREAAANDSAIEVDTAIQNGTSGLIGVKTWETMEDERVRPQQRRKTKHGWKTYYSKNGANHMVMQGKMVKTADAFDLGGGVKAQAPGQSGVAGHDINCRCFIKRDWLTAEEYAKAANQGLTDNTGNDTIKERSVLRQSPPSNTPISSTGQTIPQTQLKTTKRNYKSGFAKGVGKAHYDKMHDMLDNCDNASAVAVWEKFESQIKVISTTTQNELQQTKGSRIYINTAENEKGDFCSAPFQISFHEGSHAIDFIAGIVANMNNRFSVSYKNGLFGDTLRGEVNEIVEERNKQLKKEWKNNNTANDISNNDEAFQKYYLSENDRWDNSIHKDGKCIYSKKLAYQSITNELRHMDTVTVSDYADIIGGATKNKARGRAGHIDSYWKDSDNLPAEAFAEMMDSTIANKPSLELIKQKLPKSYKVFQNMIKEMEKI